jgi:hypothetical protein
VEWHVRVHTARLIWLKRVEELRMPTVWLTYAWDDNRTGDVDYVAQEVESDKVNVKLDRWNLRAGKRLWEQIATFISKPAESDAWMIYATQASLASEPCKEELAYALKRALETRTNDFPIIALFPSRLDSDLIPPHTPHTPEYWSQAARQHHRSRLERADPRGR